MKQQIDTQNEFFINILTTTIDILKKEEVFHFVCDGRYDYSDTHLDEVGSKIATELNGRYHEGMLYVSNEIGDYSFVLRYYDYIESNLKELKAVINKTWKTSVSKPSLKKNYIIQPNSYRNIAEMFTSLDEVLECRDYITACENLEQAMIHLDKFKAEQPDNTKAIEKLSNMVAMWQEDVDSWLGVYSVAKDIDYDALAIRKANEAITALANENEAIKAMIEEDSAKEPCYLKSTSSRSIYDLFKSFALEPSNNLALYLGLRVVETVMTDMIPANFTRSEDGEVVTHIPSRRRYLTIEDYLTDLNSKSIILKDSIKDTFYKKDGMKKKLSSRKYDRCRSMEYQLEKLNESIIFVTKNQNVFKSYMSKWNPQN